MVIPLSIKNRAGYRYSSVTQLTLYLVLMLPANILKLESRSAIKLIAAPSYRSFWRLIYGVTCMAILLQQLK